MNSRITVTKINEILQGRICIKLGILQAQSFVIRKVAIVHIAARLDPVKKNALNSEPKRALSLGYANSGSSNISTYTLFEKLQILTADQVGCPDDPKSNPNTDDSTGSHEHPPVYRSSLYIENATSARSATDGAETYVMRRRKT
jgi:hypothetical protein